MRRQLLLLWCLTLALAFVVGCGQSAPDNEAEAPAEVAEVTDAAPTAAPTDTVAPPTNTPEPTATDEPTETPEPTVTAEPTFTPTPEVVASNCLSCHADQQMLINTAAPEEEAPGEAESSGVG